MESRHDEGDPLSDATPRSQFVSCQDGGIGSASGRGVGANVFSGFTDRSVDFETVSAYSYLSFFCGYPGMTLAVWSAAKMSSANRTLTWTFIVVGIIAFMFPFIFGGAEVLCFQPS